MFWRVRSCAIIAVLVLPAGCSRQGTRTQDFTPATDKARKALEAALEHWKGGNPPGTVPGTSPQVEVVDSNWRSGQKIASYEILGEEPGTEPPMFKVRLTPVSGAPQEVRYAVFGIDPLHVYREVDYKSLSGAGK